MPVPPNIKCACGVLVHPDQPNVIADNDGGLWHEDCDGVHFVDGPPLADPVTFADTCCGKCPFGTCYVDQMTGA